MIWGQTYVRQNKLKKCIFWSVWTIRLMYFFLFFSSRPKRPRANITQGYIVLHISIHFFSFFFFVRFQCYLIMVLIMKDDTERHIFCHKFGKEEKIFFSKA